MKVMKLDKKFFQWTALCWSLSGVLTPTWAASYQLDTKHMNVGFKIKHLVISNVHGRFNQVEGSFDYDAKAKKLENVAVTIEAKSIDTNEADRDKHLRSADFFDVEKFPQIHFKGKKSAFKGSQPTELHGDLTIRGITKPVVLKVNFLGETKDPWGYQRVGFEAKAQIQRKDFGMTWNKALDTGGLVVGETVDIIIEAEAIAKK